MKTFRQKLNIWLEEKKEAERAAYEQHLCDLYKNY